MLDYLWIDGVAVCTRLCTNEQLADAVMTDAQELIGDDAGWTRLCEYREFQRLTVRIANILITRGIR